MTVTRLGETKRLAAELGELQKFAVAIDLLNVGDCGQQVTYHAFAAPVEHFVAHKLALWGHAADPAQGQRLVGGVLVVTITVSQDRMQGGLPE